jgi:prevent-host-death family protein
MSEVGLRELKNRLAACVREARPGRELHITDRGRVVARLVPPDWASPRRPWDSLYPDLPPLLRRRSAAELLREERGGH